MTIDLSLSQGTSRHRLNNIFRDCAKKRLAMLAALLLGGIFSLPAISQPPLRVLAWPGYADDDVVKEFQRQTQRKVEVIYVSSDDDLWNKAGSDEQTDFDVFAVNTAELQRYIKKSAVLPIDLQLIPNHQNQLPRFRTLLESSTLTENKVLLAVPYTYSEMGLIYNKDQIHAAPTSINALWAPEYQGKVLAFDTSNHNFTIAAQALGYTNPFHLTEMQLQQAAIKLVQLRRNIFTFYTDPDEAVSLYKEADIALIYANFGAQQLSKMKEAGLNIGYSIPQEGAFAWLDCWVISRNASDVALAHAWINYMLSPTVSNLLTTRQGLANTLTNPKGQKEEDKIIWLQPLMNSDQRSTLWERIRAGDTLETPR